MNALRSNYSGIIYAIFSAILVGIMGALVKASSTILPAAEIVFARGVLSFLIISIIMIKNGHSFTEGNKLLLTLRGILGAIALLGYFYAISKLKLGEASILLQLAPIFVLIFARIFLKEAILSYHYPILLIGLIGAALVIKPETENLITFPAFAGLIAAIFAAGAYVSIRKLGPSHNPYLIIIYFLFFSIIFSAPLMLPVFVIPTIKDLSILICIGFVSVAGQICLTKAYQIEKAAPVSMIGHSSVLFHIIFGFIFFNEVLDIYSIVGGSLILLSCFIIAILKKKRIFSIRKT